MTSLDILCRTLTSSTFGLLVCTVRDNCSVFVFYWFLSSIHYPATASVFSSLSCNVFLVLCFALPFFFCSHCWCVSVKSVERLHVILSYTKTSTWPDLRCGYRPPLPHPAFHFDVLFMEEMFSSWVSQGMIRHLGKYAIHFLQENEMRGSMSV